MKLSTTLRRKAFPLILMYSIASILCCLTVPLMVPMVTATSTVTFSVANVTGGVASGEKVTVDIYIDAPEGSAIVGWMIDVEVNASVLEPGFKPPPPPILPATWAWAGESGYFLYDWATANNYTTAFNPGDRDRAAGTINGTIEGVVGWKGLERGEGASGTGKLCTLYFKSKSETLYSPIKITKAYYFTSWNNPDQNKQVPDIINGHYPPTYDVAVTSVSAPSQATAGDIVPINVTVDNLDDPAVLNLTLTYDTAIETRLMLLASATSKTESFTWNTAGLTPGEYVINATAIRPGDVYPTNNFDTTTITLLAHDVAVTDIRASSYEVNITTQLTVTISVNVTNEGDLPETFNVTLRYDTTDIATKTVTNLPPGESTTVDFEWNVAGVPLRTPYTIEAEAILAGDNDPADNKMTSEWTIEIVPEFPTVIPLLLLLAILAVSTIILKRRTQKHLLTQT